MAKNVTTYEPDNSLKKGYFSVYAEIIRDVIFNRWLTWQLFKRDFLTMYKQSVVGILWAFIIPLVSVGTFIVLNRAGIFSIGEINVPYPIYALLGISFWQLFSTGLVAASNSLVSAGDMIVKINFSRKSLVFASTGKALVSFLVQFVLVLILFAFYRYLPSGYIFLVPFLLIPSFLLMLGFGFIFALFSSVMRDITNAISILMTFLLFLTPILYAKPNLGVLEKITQYNPIYYLISVPRDLVLMGEASDWKGFWISAAVSVIIFIIFSVIFHLTETRAAERV